MESKTTFMVGRYVVTGSSANTPSIEALREAAQFLVDKFERDRMYGNNENRSA